MIINNSMPKSRNELERFLKRFVDEVTMKINSLEVKNTRLSQKISELEEKVNGNTAENQNG